MDTAYFLIIAESTSQMLLINEVLKDNSIETDMVPAPPESGTVCAISVKIKESDLNKAENLLQSRDIKVKDIIKEKKLKLQKLIDEQLEKNVSVKFLEILKKIEDGDDLKRDEIIYLLSTSKQKEIEMIYKVADKIRKKMVGDAVEIRGAIEFSNYCNKNCKYCGINASNKSASRYRMEEDEILEVVYQLKEIGIKTVILQSGEDNKWSTEKVANLVKRIKNETQMRITLSVGEKTKEEYKLLKDAGADNYLLKIETTNRDVFKTIHPDDDFDYRVQCSKWLKELGYLNGSGCIIGLPGQKIEDIADDILFFKEMGINMIGIGPFIPAKGTPLEEHPFGDVQLTLRAVAVTRIVCKKVYIPSTTALASMNKDAQVWALECGANTIMLINTPAKYRENYKIYDNKNMVNLDAARYAVEKSGREFPKYLRV